jgi:hypothetical protein
MGHQRLLSLFAPVVFLAYAFFSVVPAVGQPQSRGWMVFKSEQGTLVDYPRDLFSVREGVGDPAGTMLATADGRAHLHIFAVPNRRGETPAQFLARVAPAERRKQLAYDRVTSSFFAVSQAQHGLILYRRCNFSQDGFIHCADIRYPEEEKLAWDSTVDRISRTLRPR